MPETWVEIDLGALRENYRTMRALAAEEVKMAPVVKADAYGLGILPVARELDLLGADYFGVNNLEEAYLLRDAGIEKEILVLLGVEAGEAKEAVRLDVLPVVYTRGQLKDLDDAARSLERPARVHIKIDTGMSRLGVPWWEAAEFFRYASSFTGVRVEGLCSHFSTADEKDKTFSEYQLQKFLEAAERARDAGLRPQELHMANSGGIMDIAASHLTLARPGISLYGCLPSGDVHNPVALRHVMSLKTRIIQVKRIPTGSFVGYGNTFVTERETRLAVLPAGYANGISRLLTNRGKVLIKGEAAPVIGRVSMSLIAVDATDIPGEVKPGEEAVVMGQQGRRLISADDVAGIMDTISYEVLCLVGACNVRIYLNKESQDP